MQHRVIALLAREAELQERLSVITIEERILSLSQLRAKSDELCGLPRDALEAQLNKLLTQIERLEQEIQKRLDAAARRLRP